MNCSHIKQSSLNQIALNWFGCNLNWIDTDFEINWKPNWNKPQMNPIHCDWTTTNQLNWTVKTKSLWKRKNNIVIIIIINQYCIDPINMVIIWKTTSCYFFKLYSNLIKFIIKSYTIFQSFSGLILPLKLCENAEIIYRNDLCTLSAFKNFYTSCHCTKLLTLDSFNAIKHSCCLILNIA